MAYYYFDTSALAKHYLPETGGAWVSNIVDSQDVNGAPIHAVATVLITQVELICALQQARRNGRIGVGRLNLLTRRFLRDVSRRFRLQMVDQRTIVLAVELAQRHTLRAYDAVQLAGALILHGSLVGRGAPGINFVASDSRLLAAAQSEGLTTEDPNNYP